MTPGAESLRLFEVFDTEPPGKLRDETARQPHGISLPIWVCFGENGESGSDWFLFL